MAERKYKIIEVHRYFNLVEMQQEDPEVKAWLGQSYRGIGPYFDRNTKATATGLDFTEQKLLLPEHLGIEETDKDFRKSVIRFYDEFVTAVPKDGLKLNISLEDDSQPLSKGNMPVSIKDYITWRHIRNHNDVAKDKAEAERYYGKRYYIFDPEGVSQEATKLNELEDKAMEIYMRFKDDVIKTDQILTMLGTNITGMKNAQKVLKLKEYSQKNHKLNDVEQRESFNRFIKTATDKELEFKYLIREMIGAQYLYQVGTNILKTESGEQIGVNMDDAVLFYKNPKNSRELNLLKAEYNHKVKKGAAYLPKEAQDKASSKETESKTE